MKQSLHVLLDVVKCVGFAPAGAREALQEAVFVEEHHEFEEVVFGDFDRDFFEGIILFERGALQVLPLEVFLQCKLISQAEGTIRVLSLKSTLEIEHQKEAGVDVVLRDGRCTS